MGNSFRLCVVVVLVAMVVSCGSNPADSPSPTTNPGLPTAGQFNLPAPVDALSLVPDRTSSALLLERTGNDYVTGLAQLITDEDTSARFSPTWTEGSSGFDHLAYAIYNFNVQTYSGAEIVTLEWGEAPLDYSNLWIGIGDWNGNNWDWYAGPADGILDLQTVGYSDYTQPGTGDMLVAVVMVGTNNALLDSLSVGELETQQGDWWMFGHDAQHTRRSPYVGAQTNNVKWKFRTTGAGFRFFDSLIGPDETIYVGSGSELHALNPDGTVKWLSEAIGPSTRPTIATDGTLYIGSENNKLYALNADGSVKWFFPTGGQIQYSTPAIGADGTIFVGCHDNKLYAINPDGTEKWSFTAGDIVKSEVDPISWTVIGESYSIFARGHAA